jgi:hypothetical protein
MQGESRELEAATRNYDNFIRLQRYVDAQQQSFNTGPALETYSAHRSVPLLGGQFAESENRAWNTGRYGLLLGCAIGMLRDLLDRGIRTSGQEQAHKRKTTGSNDLFRARFDQIIDLKHRRRQGLCVVRVRREGFHSSPTNGLLPAVSLCHTRGASG